jgi:hypothetical protein
MAIGGHFSLRSPPPVPFFGRYGQKIGRWFWEKAVLGPDRRESPDFPAKNMPL